MARIYTYIREEVLIRNACLKDCTFVKFLEDDESGQQSYQSLWVGVPIPVAYSDPLMRLLTFALRDDNVPVFLNWFNCGWHIANISDRFGRCFSKDSVFYTRRVPSKLIHILHCLRVISWKHLILGRVHVWDYLWKIKILKREIMCEHVKLASEINALTEEGIRSSENEYI